MSSAGPVKLPEGRGGAVVCVGVGVAECIGTTGRYDCVAETVADGVVLAGAGFLAGVVAVGSLSLAVPNAFPDATVWSRYGSGYGFVPAVLPCLALWWLRTLAAGVPGGRCESVPGGTVGA